MSYKPHFQRFLSADPDRLHFAAHSHHLWPDVTFDAQRNCWLEAALFVDRKWQRIFEVAYPKGQGQVARLLNLNDPSGVVFGPNTHSFAQRLLSCLPHDRVISVLTTDSEFHSFSRQMRRLAEAGTVRLSIVPSEPFATFTERFAAAAAGGGHDMIYLSQVFYNSGYLVDDLPALVSAVPDDETLVVIDGYHAFMALPSDLLAVQDRAFYLAGGYKYAMAGEGVAFLHAPRGYAPRPRDTGWYAAIGALEAGQEDKVAFADDGSRFLGATFDPVGIYRLNAVMDWLAAEDLSPEKIHAHAHALQDQFVAGLGALGLESLHAGQLLIPLSEPKRGNFLTFQTEQAGEIYSRLLEAKIVTDCRGDRLRFGFGIYQDQEDVERLCHRLAQILA